AGLGNCTCTDCDSLNQTYPLTIYVGDPCNACAVFSNSLATVCSGTQGIAIWATFGSTYDSVLDQCLLTLDATVYVGSSLTTSATYSAKWAPDSGKCSGGAQSLAQTGI